MELLSRARRALLYEISIYVNLVRWITRRPAVRPGEQPIGYARLVTPVMALWIFGSAVEIPVAHLLIPWETVRLIVLGIGVWGLVWMLGALAGLRVYPHVLTDDELRVRHAARVQVTLPWDVISDLRAERREHPSSMRAVQLEGTALAIAVSGETNVTALLREPTTVRLPAGPATITSLSFLVDEPRELLAAARPRLRPTVERADRRHAV